jgi:hypothetical protein
VVLFARGGIDGILSNWRQYFGGTKEGGRHG